MKRFFFTIALMATVCLSRSFAQEQQAPSAQILTTYYGVKDALVNSDPNTAAIKNPYFGSGMLTCGKTTQTLN